MAILRISDPDGGSREHGLAHVRTTLGRGKANTVVLIGDDRSSLRHAVVERCPEGYLVRDAMSTNGTWVNGELIESRMLDDGDEIRVGDTVIVFVE